MAELHTNQEIWLQNAPDQEELRDTVWDTYFNASFLSRRKLDLRYLGGAPLIWFFRIGDEMVIRWESGKRLKNGESLWESIQGEYRMSVEAFRKEIIEFFNRFQQQMDQQVQEVYAIWPLPKVKLDIDRLREEHFKYRLSEFEEIKRKIRKQENSPENWDTIQRAIEVIDTNTY